MAIQWTSDLITGIEVIDNQHKRIVDYINQLETAKTKEPHFVGQVLEELVDYTLSHFAFEESLQEQAGYKLAKPHKAIHEAFTKRIAKYQEKYAAGEDIVGPLHDMLCTWLMHHIKRDDMDYVTSVKKVVDEQNKEGGWLSRTLGRFFKK